MYTPYMLGTEVTLVAAFAAGVVSFLSPCVLPLIPGFLLYIAGDGTTCTTPRRLDTFLASLAFVIGFALIFVSAGLLLSSVLSFAAAEAHTWLARIGGALVIAFGVYMTGTVRVPFLEKVRTVRVFRKGLPGAFLFGAAFAAGWTPCVGAALGAILGLTLAHPAAASALLFAYTLGLGVPFLVLGLFAGEAGARLAAMTRGSRIAALVLGTLIVAVGFLVLTENLGALSGFGLARQCLSGS